MLAPIAMEPTSRTGLHHVDGTLSMARTRDGAGAMGDFIVVSGAIPTWTQDLALAATISYAAFGHVVAGMEVVADLASRPSPRRPAMRGQMIAAPVRY